MVLSCKGKINTNVSFQYSFWFSSHFIPNFTTKLRSWMTCTNLMTIHIVEYCMVSVRTSIKHFLRFPTLGWPIRLHCRSGWGGFSAIAESREWLWLQHQLLIPQSLLPLLQQLPLLKPFLVLYAYHLSCLHHIKLFFQRSSINYFYTIILTELIELVTAEFTKLCKSLEGGLKISKQLKGTRSKNN